ncbi:MAG: FG-GAP-like repeat-containing protein [Bacteroidota bacterium]
MLPRMLASAVLVISGYATAQNFVEQPEASIPNAPKFLSSSLGTWGDFNQDGFLDLIIGGGYTFQFFLYQNSGNNTFIQKTVFGSFEGQTPNQAVWGDYNGDGYLDLFLGPEFTTGRPLIYKYNPKDGIFEKQQIQLDIIAPRSAKWVDLDSDGDLDLMAVGAGAGDMKTLLYRNSGGQFVKIQHNIPPALGTLDAGDVDLDGDQDVLVTQIGNLLDRTELYLNDGNANFTRAPVDFPSLVSNFGTYAKWMDADHDGDLDICLFSLTNAYEDIARIYVNEGAEGFKNMVTVQLPKVSAREPMIGDVDNDGDQDILISDWFTQTLLRNNGNLNFQKIRLPIRKVIAGVSLGDADNDADLDLVVVGGVDTVNRSQVPYFYKNEIQAKNSKPQAPTEVTSSLRDGKLTINWTEGSDAETPAAALTYNVYLYNKTTSVFKVSPHADTTSGFRRIVENGNAGTMNTMILKDFASGTYVIGVQTIDAAYSGSPFTRSSFTWGVAGKAVACASDTGYYSTTAGLTDYTWTVTGGTIVGTSTASTIRVVWDTPGTNQVGVVTSLGTFSLPVTVLTNPKPVIIPQGVSLTVTSGKQFQWFTQTSALNPISQATTSSYTPEASGDYCVRVRYSNECMRLSDPYVFVLTAVEKNDHEQLTIFPNPSNGQVQVKAKDGERYRIMNGTGQLMKQGITQGADGKVFLDTSDLPAGVYVVQLGRQSIRMVVNH